MPPPRWPPEDAAPGFAEALTAYYQVCVVLAKEKRTDALLVWCYRRLCRQERLMSCLCLAPYMYEC